MYAILNNNNLPNDYIYSEIEKKDCIFPEVNTQLGVINCDYTDSNNVCIVFYGILYNKTHLAEYLNFSPEQSTTISYSKLIIYLYLKYGLEHTLCLLNGDFAFLLLDYDINNNSKLYVVRNPIGTQPIYKYTQGGYSGESYLISNKLHKFTSLWSYSPQTINKHVELIDGGTYHVYTLSLGVSPKWKFVSQNNYFNLPLFSNSFCMNISINHNNLLEQLEGTLYQTILTMVHSQPNKSFGIIDYGDIGSAILNDIVQKVCKNNNHPPPEIYHFVFEKTFNVFSGEVKSSKEATKNYGENVIYASGKCVYECIPHLIQIMEICDADTLHELIPLYFVSKYIQEKGLQNNIFCNIGVNILFGSWMHYGKCADPIEYNQAIHASLKTASKCTYLGASNICDYFGLQLCAPFIQQTLICNMLNIDPCLQYCMYKKMDYCMLKDLCCMLNIDVFSKGVKSSEAHMAFSKNAIKHKTIHEETSNMQTIIEEEIGRKHNILTSSEYYKSIYNEYFGNILESAKCTNEVRRQVYH